MAKVASGRQHGDGRFLQAPGSRRILNSYSIRTSTVPYSSTRTTARTLTAPGQQLRTGTLYIQLLNKLQYRTRSNNVAAARNPYIGSQPSRAQRYAAGTWARTCCWLGPDDDASSILLLVRVRVQYEYSRGEPRVDPSLSTSILFNLTYTHGAIYGKHITYYIIIIITGNSIAINRAAHG